MSFKQLRINLDSKLVDKLSDLFLEVGALSVSIEDQYEGTPLEEPLFNEPGMVVDELWQHSTLVVLLDSNFDLEHKLPLIKSILNQEFDYTTEIVDDQDWVRLTQSQFEPIKVNDKLYIVPSWHEIPDKKAITITLDPGLAFGTGSHPTTFMCLEWLATNIKPNNKVLDYGCGSGILAIAAKKLGAKLVCGVDIDPQALEASKSNAITNQVDIYWSDVGQLKFDQFDIVVANILSNPLRMLAPALANLTNNKLILSGILLEQAEELSAIYEKWFNVTVKNNIDNWCLLECSR